MAITIREIARLAGVSVGTVDRALHDRGRVNPEVAQRIKRIAGEYGYEASRVGRALALARNPVKIGIIIHLARTEFFQQLNVGVEAVKAELEGMGAEVYVERYPQFNAVRQLAALDRMLELGVQGIALSPVGDPEVKERIDEIVEATGMPIVTFNTDLPDSRRSCFVGQDSLQSGRAAAGLMGTLLGGRGTVSIITGHLTNLSTIKRTEGFLEELQSTYPEIQSLGVQVGNDRNSTSMKIVERMLATHPDLQGIYAASGGQAGVCRGLERAGRAGSVKLVAFDLVPSAKVALKNGTIDFLIDQNAYEQGYRPARILFDCLLNKSRPEKEFYYTDILIKTKYNL